jgi:hypothetical protein
VCPLTAAVYEPEAGSRCAMTPLSGYRVTAAAVRRAHDRADGNATVGSSLWVTTWERLALGSGLRATPRQQPRDRDRRRGGSDTARARPHEHVETTVARGMVVEFEASGVWSAAASLTRRRLMR